MPSRNFPEGTAGGSAIDASLEVAEIPLPFGNHSREAEFGIEFDLFTLLLGVFISE